MGSLDRSAASSFVYAKASGLLSKSFTGDNAIKLFQVQSLRELFTLLFDEEVPAVPEVMLAKEIEKKAEKNLIDLYKSLLSEFANPSPILSEILSFYEYEHSYNLTKGPDEDKKRIMALWNAISSLKGSDRQNLLELYKMEISFKNILWVLRLKVYYKFTAEEILEHLVYSDDMSEKSAAAKKIDVLAREAVAIADKDISSYDEWKKWKYAGFLNPHEEGVIWEIDPVWIERSLKTYLAKTYKRFFHKDPMSVTSLVSWFRIKQYELDCIRSVAEGLRLGVESEKVMEVSGISSVVSQGGVNG
ncbi:MAG: V-type ATPase subunit [Treponema sp.]|nr:V-type ATPase subunit [Treponema sp.]